MSNGYGNDEPKLESHDKLIKPLKSKNKVIYKPEPVKNIPFHSLYRKKELDIDRFAKRFLWWEPFLAVILSSSSCIFPYDVKTKKIISRNSHSAKKLYQLSSTFKIFTDSFGNDHMKTALETIAKNKKKLNEHRPLELEEQFSVTTRKNLYDNTGTLAKNLSNRPKNRFYGLAIAHCSEKVLQDLQDTFQTSFGINFLLNKREIKSSKSKDHFSNLQSKNASLDHNKKGKNSEKNKRERNRSIVYVLRTSDQIPSAKFDSDKQRENYAIFQEVLHWCYIEDGDSLDEVTTYVPPDITLENDYEKAIHIPHVSHKQFVTDILFQISNTSEKKIVENEKLRRFVIKRLNTIRSQFKKNHLNRIRSGFPFQITSKIITWWMLLSGVMYESPYYDGNLKKCPKVLEILTDVPFEITDAIRIHWNNNIVRKQIFGVKECIKASGHSLRYPFLFNQQEEKTSANSNTRPFQILTAQTYHNFGHYLPYHGLFQSSKDLQGYHNPYLRSWIIFEEDLTYFKKFLDNSVLNKFRNQLKDFQHITYMYHVLDSVPEVKKSRKSVNVNQYSMRSQKALQNKIEITGLKDNMNLNENIQEKRSPRITKSEKELQKIIKTYKPLNSSVSPNLENNNGNNLYLEATNDDYTPSPQLLKKVNRTYNMGIRIWLTDEEKAGKSHYEICRLRRILEKRANNIVYSLQAKLGERITPETIDTAIELVRDLKEKDRNKERKYSNKFATSDLGALIKERNINMGLNDNFGRAPNSVLISAVNGMLDQEKKILKFIDLFDEYPEEATTWLIMGRTPFLEKKLKYLLNVKFDFVRNLVLSARKVFDSHLPVEMQLHAPFPDITLEKLSKATTDFITTKLNDLEEQLSYRQVNENNKPPELTQRQKSFKSNLLTLQLYQKEVTSFLNDAVLDWNNPHDTTPATRWTLLKQTAKKLSEFIIENADFSSKNVQTNTNNNNTTSNNKKTKNKKNLNSIDAYQYNSILRGILMTALSPSFNTNNNKDCTKNGKIVIEFKDNGFIRPDKLVSKPFMKKIRQNIPIRFPLPLLIGKKFLITRPGNAKQLTTYVKDFGKFPIHIYPPEKPNAGVFAEVIVPKKVQEFIQRGATIDIIRITSGSAPALKVIVSLALSGKFESFLSKKFIKSTPKMLPKNVSIPVDAMGIDLNRPGKHVVAFSEDDVTLPPILEKLSQRYKAKEKIIAHYQSQYERLRLILLNPDTRSGSKKAKDLIYNIKRFDSKKTFIKLLGEVSRLHVRRIRLLKELHREVSRTISTMLVRSQSLILCVEDLDISVRGKRGALAKAILSMPDEPDLVEKACLVSEHNTRRPIRLISVDPRNTSKGKHIGCSKNPPGNISRTSQSYDFTSCSGCNEMLNTHVHAAKVIKRRGLTNISMPINIPS